MQELFDFENKYTQQGYKKIAGMDEAGRGPLAGPVVCACVIMPLGQQIIEGINDSKKLTPKKREELFEKIISTAIDYKIVEISPKTIDEINILNATKKGMQEAVEGLKMTPDVVLIDAVKLNIPIKQENIIHGDARSYSIAAASILAKVYRDRLMLEMAKKYPQYGFEKHKGYGTALHIQTLKEYGKCDIHRDSFIGHFI